MGLLSFAVDLRALALFRAGLAATILVDTIDRAAALELQTDLGPAPVAMMRAAGVSPWSLHALGGLQWQWVLCAVTVAVALALLVGWRSRSMAIAALVLVASVQDRTPLTFFRGDALLVVSLFWACFVPLGARLSVDSRGARGPGEVRSVASAALLLQPVLLYVCSVGWKLTGESWRSGEMLRESLQLWIHASALGDWVSANAPPALLVALTWLTLVIEGLAPFGLIARAPALRVLGVVALSLLQSGMEALMTVGWFALIASVVTLPALPAAVFRDRPLAVSLHAPAPARATQVVVGLALAWVFATNVLGPFVHVPSVRVLAAVGLTQQWAMFKNGKALPRGWFYAVGRRANGPLVEVITGAERPSGQRPTQPFSEYLAFRERHLLTTLLYPSGAPFLAQAGLWLCDRANRGRAGAPVLHLTGSFAAEGPGAVAWTELFDVDCRPPVAPAP